MKLTFLLRRSFLLTGLWQYLVSSGPAQRLLSSNFGVTPLGEIAESMHVASRFSMSVNSHA